MNFYNDEENEKKAGAPALPRAASPFKKTSAFGKSPLFSRAAGGIMDRLKNLSRRDMALVGLGLSVLTMVPVAEYMMSQPSQDNVLSGGWGGKEKLGDMPYEPGINSLSQGSADGSGEVITPLSSRDPVSLILGSQPAQPAAAAPVYTPPVSNMRDAMRDAGREAFSAASKSAGAPTVIPKMAAGLRGMSSFFGGGESSRTQGSLGGGKIIDDARSASSKSAKRSMVGPVAIAGYKGVASTPNSASKGAFEKLRAAADKSAGNFSGGSAMRSLDKAAADALEIGKGAGGMGAGGDSDKTGKTSGNTVKGYEHNRSGESLEEMAAKQRMNKALEWEFFKKYEIKKQIINAILGAVTGVMGDFIKDNLKGALGMNPGPAKKCWWPKNPTVPVKPENLAQNMKDCKNGAMISPVSYVGAGDKATNAGYEAYCPCGNAVTATIDAPGGTTDPAVVAENAQQVNVSAGNAVAALKDLDPVLTTIITQTGNAAANPKDKAVVVQSAKSAAGAFSELSNVKSRAFNPLLNAHGAANTAASGYSTIIAQYRGKHQAAVGKYTVLLDQVGKVETGIADCSKPTIKMKDLGGGKLATLAPGDCQKVKDWIAAWKEPAKKDLDAVSESIEIHATALGKFQAEIDSVKTSIGEMQSSYDGIQAAYGKIQPAPIQAVELSTGIIGLNAMTAQLKESLPEGVTAVERENTPMHIAAGLRALDREATWKSYTLTLDEKVKTAEGEKWAQVMSAISGNTAIDGKTAAAKDLVSNYMRSDEIKTGIEGKTPDFDARIKVDIGNIESAMETLKTNITSTGIDGSAFPGGGTTTAPKPPVDNPAGNNDPAGQNPPATTGKLTAAGEGLRSQKLDRYEAAADRFDATGTQAEGLPEAVSGSDYAGKKAAVQTSRAALTSAKAKMDSAKANLETAKTDEEVMKASKELDTASSGYNAAQKDFNSSYSSALGASRDGAKLTALQEQARADYMIIADAYNACTATRRCSVELATRLNTMYFGSALGRYNSVMSSGDSSAARALAVERNTACRDLWRVPSCP